MVEDPVAKWEEFIRSRYWDELLELADSYPLRRSLVIKFPDIDRYDPEFADELLEKPGPLLEAAETALLEIDLPIDVLLEKAHFRIVGLPRRYKTSELRSDQIGRLIALEGLVRTVTEVRPKVISAAFECQRCGHVFYKEQTTSKFQEPYDCPNDACDRRGPFKLLLDRSRFVDAQNVRVQESPEELRGGEQPQTLDVQLEDDLTGMIYPGDRVVVNGALRSYQRTTQTGKSTYFDLFLEGNSIEMMEQEFEEIDIKAEDERLIRELSADPQIYENIRKSIAPSIYGYEEVKEALALQLFSGVSKGLPDGTRIRGDIHILLVGDPGIAKSQLLRYISKLSPRGIYTSGKSSTSAGLTATAVKDELGDGRWSIEAGALVLADKGIACIDEMDKMRSEDRSALHEAMEQQTISVAKAGVMATLKSRCALLAAANPKFGRFDKYEGIAQQINLSPALMSRFDLIFVLTDEPSDARDTQIARHIGQTTYAGEISSRGGYSKEELEAVMDVIRPSIEPEVLRKYIAYARKNVFPVLSDGARERLESYYVNLRKQGQDTNKPVPVTARQLEALFRLSESSARLRLSDDITLGDAERVIRIVEACLRQVGVDPETGLLDADVLAVGMSKSTRDKTRMVIDLVRDVASLHQGPAPLETVLERAEAELGMDRNKAEEIIKRLKRDGSIFEPRNGFLNLT
ncbi:MAG: Minichromosome maintenance protein MCM [Methanothrix sp.]|jgi:replicative DNA helicase Mcm|nr:MAG: Minichromosome maintenance protein MCM [Methanothrix sp.]